MTYALKRSAMNEGYGFEKWLDQKEVYDAISKLMLSYKLDPTSKAAREKFINDNRNALRSHWLAGETKGFKNYQQNGGTTTVVVQQTTPAIPAKTQQGSK